MLSSTIVLFQIHACDLFLRGENGLWNMFELNNHYFQIFGAFYVSVDIFDAKFVKIFCESNLTW